MLDIIILKLHFKERINVEEFNNVYNMTDEEIIELYNIYEYDLYVNSSAGFVDEI